MPGTKFSPEQLKHYEEVIKAELKESMAYVDNINRDQSIGARESSGDLSSYAFHQADQGSDTNLMEHTVMMMEQEREKIRLLNDALKRIYDGTFGICEICGENIQPARLDAIPYVSNCFECTVGMEDKKRKQRR